MKRYEDRPFAIIGVNTGDDPETYRKGLEDHGITWISAYQGPSSIVSTLFRVEGYPTYLLIDHEGRIVSRGQGVDDDRIEQVVQAAEAADE